MTTSIWVENNKIKIRTDDPSVKYLLESTKKEWTYIPFKHKYGYANVICKIYDEKRMKADSFGFFNFTIGLGWTGYILSTFGSYITQNEYNNLIASLYSKSYRDTPFPELRDYQNQDVLYLLRHRRGLFSCYTSYGKKSIAV